MKLDKPCSGRLHLGHHVWLQWYWYGEQIDARGWVEWSVALGEEYLRGGKAACRRDQARQVALRRAGDALDRLRGWLGEAEERADELLGGEG